MSHYLITFLSALSDAGSLFVAAAGLIGSLQTIVSREVGALEACVVTVALLPSMRSKPPAMRKVPNAVKRLLNAVPVLLSMSIIPSE